MTRKAVRRVPDFFLIGAPRSGTTAMYGYLRAHPGVFLPHSKEPCHLCPDLDSGSREDAVRFMRDPARYFALFEGVAGSSKAGEACVLYLYSREAPRLISELNPHARILAMLRNPVEQAYSHHATRVAGGEEDLDFEAALEAEADRLRGRRLPARARNLTMYQYRATARYAEPLARYLEHFGRDSVRVMIFEEFVAQPARLYRATLEFLEVDTAFQPRFDVVNANRSAGRGPVFRLLRWSPLITTAKKVVPGRLRPAAARVAGRLLRVGTREVPRPSLEPRLRARLANEFRPDVARLSELLGRDLAEVWPDFR